MILLISGHMGSGKSVLRRIIHSHPDVTLLDDLGAFDRINASWRNYLKGLKLGWRYPSHRHPLTLGFTVNFLTKLAWRTVLKQRVEWDDVAAVLQGISPQTAVIGDVYSRYLHSLAKEGQNPQLKTIIVYRDCRDLAAEIGRRFLQGAWRSTRDNARHRPWLGRVDTAGKVAQSWLSSVELMEQAQGDIFTVRYEDLVTDPKAVLLPLEE